MRIFIHTDLEGISGIDSIDMLDRSGPAYHRSCEMLMADVNAAVDGAFAGGAEQVTVLDSHGGGSNFILDLLDPRANNDPRANGKWWGELDPTYGGTFFIGAHAMAGTINGFLDHTQSSVAWFEYAINGRRMGELAQWAIVAGGFGVPLLMVSGDEAACVEARQFFHPIETAIVKRGIGRNRAELAPEAEARAAIRESARKAISLAGQARPFALSMPMEIRLTFTRSDYCDAALGRPGAERIDARTVRKLTSDPQGILI